jgi:hypothetical protein
MPPSKVSHSVVKLVLELADQQKEPAGIAQILNLKEVQVSTLLAYGISSSISNLTVKAP